MTSPQELTALRKLVTFHKKRAKAWEIIAKGRAQLLQCYRLGTQQGADAALTKIEKGEATLAQLDEAVS